MSIIEHIYRTRNREFDSRELHVFFRINNTYNSQNIDTIRNFSRNDNVITRRSQARLDRADQITFHVLALIIVIATYVLMLKTSSWCDILIWICV